MLFERAAGLLAVEVRLLAFALGFARLVALERLLAFALERLLAFALERLLAFGFERLLPFGLERLLDDEALLVRATAVRARAPARPRSDAGISSWATAFTSAGMSRSRKLAIRSSSRRIARATFAVSLSPTASASASIAL